MNSKSRKAGHLYSLGNTEEPLVLKASYVVLTAYVGCLVFYCRVVRGSLRAREIMRETPAEGLACLLRSPDATVTATCFLSLSRVPIWLGWLAVRSYYGSATAADASTLFKNWNGLFTPRVIHLILTMMRPQRNYLHLLCGAAKARYVVVSWCGRFLTDL